MAGDPCNEEKGYMTVAGDPVMKRKTTTVAGDPVMKRKALRLWLGTL